MKIQYPDYNNSIVSISNSILYHYGAKTHHSTLPLLDNYLSKNYKNIVLIIFDGLGINVLEKNLPEKSFFRKNIKTEISSVFPPTTTAAITSITSGKMPNEHGWIGWSCYFSEIDKCVDLFSSNESGISEGVQAFDEHIPNKYLSFENILTQIKKATNDEIKTYQVSPFSKYFANTCEGLCEHIKNLCDNNDKKFIYAYHFQPDHDMHDFGVNPQCVTTMIENFDKQIEDLVESVHDTLFIITADHGMTDIKMMCVEDFPLIQNCLVSHICMEPRCCSFYVKDEFKAEFPKLFSDAFEDKFILYTHEEFTTSGLLGGGKSHSKVNDFVGDYVAVAVSDIALWYKDNMGEYNDFKGAHAGLTDEEIVVPLIVIERN